MDGWIEREGDGKHEEHSLDPSSLIDSKERGRGKPLEVSFESGFETKPTSPPNSLSASVPSLTLLLHESSIYSRTGVAGGCRSTAQFFFH